MEKISLNWPKNLGHFKFKVATVFVAIVWGVAENSKEKVAGLKTKNWERYELKRKSTRRGV